jgi:hypothetical protein
MAPYSSLSARVVLAWGGIQTAVLITFENSLGRLKGLQLTMRYSISGEQKLDISFTLEPAQQLLLNEQTHNPLPFDFPRRRWTILPLHRESTEYYVHSVIIQPRFSKTCNTAAFQVSLISDSRMKLIHLIIE